MATEKLRILRTHLPAEYEIHVQGMLDDHWSDYFGGMEVISSKVIEEDKTPVTTITGTVSNQAELYRVLNKLYSLGMPLLNVECLSNNFRRK